MRTFLKTIGVFILVSLSAVSIALGAFILFTADCKLDESKLLTQGTQIIFYDKGGNEIVQAASGGKILRTSAELPSYVKTAFVAVEDKRFYSHSGVDPRGLFRALFADLRSGSLKEGGSTISQQLVKNTHLSGEKTLKRKLKEVRLALKLERRFDKDEILDFYLDGIYFGNGAYGVESAARTYFAKKASELSLSQAAALAATVKAPARYRPGTKDGENRRRLVLKLMLEQGYISNEQYASAVQDMPTLATEERQDSGDYFKLAREELYRECSVSPYEKETVRVFTYYDRNAQNALDKLSIDSDKIVENGLIASRFGEILAIKAPTLHTVCMPASTIKPLLVYAAAFNEGMLSPATLIDDSPVSFGDYSPSNYGGVCHGYTSAKQCLAKSLNIPAVKIFDSVGVKKCIAYAKKADLNVSENALTAALGCYAGGEDFIKLCLSYTPFLSDGVYYAPKIIKSVRIGRLTAYKAKNEGVRIFKSGTADLVNECLMECAKSGTARALCQFDFQICAKTGTNGTAKGNTDALSVSYTSENIIGVCLQPKSGLLDCNVTGGTATRAAVSVIEDFYKDRAPLDFNRSDSIVEKRLCKLAYEDGRLLLAPENQPEKYCFSSLFLSEYAPTEFSELYLSPTVTDFSVLPLKDEVKITVVKNNCVRYRIIRLSGGEEKIIADLCDDRFIDKGLKDGKYAYFIEPYVKNGESENVGKRIKIADILVDEKARFIQSEDWFDD